MARRIPQENVEDDSGQSSGHENELESSTNQPSEQLDQPVGEEDMEEAFHTEESDLSNASDRDDGSELEEYDIADLETQPSATDPPLLPAELLKPLPSPANSPRHAVSIPWSQMTRAQKKGQRRSSRQAKKREWDRLRREANETGVLQAGKAAQLKRGIKKARDKVKSGRIEKKEKSKPSGRQQLLEQRKRLVEESNRELMKPAKKAKTRAKR